MRYAPVLPPLLALVAGCEALAAAQSPTPTRAPAQPAIIYAESSGLGAWHIRGNRFWNGPPSHLYAAPLSTASASVTYSQTAEVACVEAGLTFGAPDTLFAGARFQCGTAQFRIVDCDEPETCRYAQIEATMRTGVAPGYGSLVAFYWYNRCRGVESITLENPRSVGFGETLELRQGPGLLARPDSPECRNDPSSALYDATAEPAAIYAEGDGRDAWHIRGNRFWNGNPGHLDRRPLNRAPASVVHSRTSNAACVDLGGMTFGAPDALRLGEQFQCGEARFEVVECNDPNRCYARIAATWRTGIAPNYRSVPVFYWYNRCRGVESITFSLARPLRVGFGETLELRQGPGLLAQPDSPACRNDPRSALYD